MQLIISDYGMPRMDGRELYLAVRASGRRVPFLFTSGAPIDDDSSADPRQRVLPKPYSLDQLERAVQEMLAL